MKEMILTEDIIWDVADGVDFCPVFGDNVYKSFTKDEYLKLKYFPKMGRKYWIMIDGEKRYLKLDKKTVILDCGKIMQEI